MRSTAPLLALLWISCAAPEAGPDGEVGATTQALFSGAGSVAAEATVFENQTANNGGSYTEFCVGNLASTGTTRRAFVRYDLPSIPSGATVTRVRIQFTQELVRFMGTGAPKTATLQMHRATSFWSEGAGGFNSRSCGGGTNVAGVDWSGMPSVSGTLSGTESLPSSNDAVITFDTNIGTDDDPLIDDVQAWVDGTANRGWRLRVSEEGTIDNARSIRPGSLLVEWRLPNGSTCTVDSDCTSNACVGTDGLNCGGRAGCVCCNASTCANDCQSCHLGGSVGTCSPRSAATVCRSPSCAAGVATLQTTCNGVSGSCPAATMQDCTPYFCDGNACATSCSDNTDCEATFFCDAMNECDTVSNECVAGLDDCVRLATCSDPSTTLGDYVCTCPMGYAGDGRSGGTGCSDIDECRAGTAGCDLNATCANTVGGFTCTCNGPEWVGDGFTCMDYDECADPFYTAMCDDDASCVNRVPGFTCVCDAGYRGDGFACTEIDECAEGSDDCHADATCTNTPGSFSCACNTGYVGDGRSCADIDECMDPTFVAGCDSNATCVNAPGSASCVCDPGYRGDGATCTNIDECAESMDDCDPNATCTDTDGSFTCACNEHYMGTGEFCADVDECAAGFDECETNEVCVNVVGARYECECRPGFTRETEGGPCVRACGDGTRAVGEQCDDGNAMAGDGCDERCEVEMGWDCFEVESETSECEFVCGNGRVDRSEECDDGAANSDTEPDACRSDCGAASCGDGVVDTGERCDDGEGNDDEAVDGCRTTCAAAYCGDGVVDTGERCDPGGLAPDEADDGTCTTLCPDDAGPSVGDAGADGGSDGGPAGGSCGCRTPGPGSAAGWPVALFGLALYLRRRRGGR